MTALLAFLVAFFFSFIGTIPPGALNLTIIQIGLEDRIGTAWRFALAAGFIEYFYAWLAVECENLITRNTSVSFNFQFIAALLMILLGIFNLLSLKKASVFTERFNQSGFRRGIFMSVLNPLAIPFWIAMTAYIKNQHWFDLSNYITIHSYLLGVSLGSISVMMILGYLAKKVGGQFQTSILLKRIPGYVLLILGSYGLVRYLLNFVE